MVNCFTNGTMYSVHTTALRHEKHYCLIIFFFVLGKCSKIVSYITKKLAQSGDAGHKVVEGQVKVSGCEALIQQLDYFCITLHL